MPAWIVAVVIFCAGVLVGWLTAFYIGKLVGIKCERDRISKLVGRKTAEEIARCIIEGKEFLVRPVPPGSSSSQEISSDSRLADVVKLHAVKKGPGDATH